MDHIGKALEKAQSSSETTVQDWMKPRLHGNPKELQAQQKEAVEPIGNEVMLQPEILIQNKVVTAMPKLSPVTDRYRLLRTRLVQIMRPRGWNVAGITSPSPEAGKTLTTVNLAITLARSGSQNVFVIDADLRRPSVAHTLGFEPSVGLVDYLTDAVPMEETLYRPRGIPNLTVVPGRGTGSLADSNELIDSSQFARLVNTLKSAGDQAIVLVDTPPIQVGDDVLRAAAVTDCFLLLIEEGQTTTPEIQDAARLLSEHNLVGTVLNKSSEKPKKFESYYGASIEKGL